MKKTASGWTVVDESAGVFLYEYEFRKNSTSNAVSVRTADGSLAVFSPAVGVSDQVLKDLERFGKVTALVANNGFHYLGLSEWTKAFPGAALYAEPGAAARIAKKVPSLPAFQTPSALSQKLGPAASVFVVPGLKMGELWFQSGSTWFVGDSFFNFPRIPGGLMGKVFQWTESGPGFRVNGLSRLFFTRDKAAYKAWALEQVSRIAPKIVVPSHGGVVTSGDPATEMRTLIEQRY